MQSSSKAWSSHAYFTWPTRSEIGIKVCDMHITTDNGPLSNILMSLPTGKSFNPRSFKQLRRIAFQIIFHLILFIHDVIDVSTIFPMRRTAPLGTLHFSHLSTTLHNTCNKTKMFKNAIQADLGELMELEPVNLVIKKGRQIWFVHTTY